MRTEDLLLTLFERTLDWVCLVDKDGWFKQVNPAVLESLGYTQEELLAEPVFVRIHPDDREGTRAVRNKLLQNEPLVNFQNRYVARDGRIIWLHWTSIYIPEKEVVFAIAKDITTQKLIELETQENFRKYKELTTHFKTMAEKDRQVVASELHEELGQLATALKMNLESIAARETQLQERTSKQLENGLATAQLLIDKIRRLSYSIDPSQIDEWGLDLSLRSICEEFAQMTGIACSYEGRFREEQLSREVKLDLFRISQEALANVLQHAEATEVQVRLQEKGDRVELSVHDNGKGMTLETGHLFDLENMRRRASSIDGDLLIETARNQGTTVTIRINA